MRKTVILLLALCLLCAAVPALAEEPVRVRVSEVTHSVFYAPQYAAMALGFFADEGLEIDLMNGGGADKVMTSVLTGEVDIGLAGPEACIYVLLEGRRDAPRVFAQLTQCDGSFIVGRQAEDFAWQNLRGKTIIGGRKGGMPEMTLEYVMRKNGVIPHEDATVDTSVQFNMMAGAFVGGEADYVALFEPTATEVELAGKGYILASIGQESASPFVLMSYRFDIALLALTVPVLLGKQKLDLRGKSIKPLLLLGSMEPCIYFIGEQYGLKYSSSAFSGIMIAVIPIVTIIFAAVFLKERPSKKQWLFSALSIVGIIVITLAENSDGSITFKGFALLCLAVVTGSAFSVISCGVSGRFSVFERTYFMQTMGAVFFTTLALIENGGSAAALIVPAANPRFILAALFLALGASVAGYSLFNYAVSHAPMANVAVFHNLATIVSVAAGIFILGEKLTAVSLGAMVVVLIGICGVQKYPPENEFEE